MWQAKLSGRLHLTSPILHKHYTSENIITVGDQVEVELSNYKERQEVEAYILSLEKRKNTLCRTNYGKIQIIGSNIDRICIISSWEQPIFRHGFIDRVLLETSRSSIPTCIILNKYDLFEKNNPEHKKIVQKINHYRSIKIQVFEESFKNKVSHLIKTMMHNNRILLVGQSGVGKSTFINQVVGEYKQATASIGSTNKGRHTTTNSKLYSIENIELIDAPGIREFGLQHLTKLQVANSFPEFFLVNCKFENCMHIQEPNCGVLEMIANKNKKLPLWRYHSYLRILQSLQEKHKYRRGDHKKHVSIP